MKHFNNSLQLELHVPDFDKVKDFYTLLGFEVMWERKPEEEKGYLVLKNKEGCVLNFWGGNQAIYNQTYFKQFNTKTKRGYGVEVVIPTSQNLQELEQKLKSKGVSIVEPLKKQPWGMYDFRCEDPFGYYLRVTSPNDITDPSNAVK